MVFGLQKLQDDLFCMTEERNYFQGKYTEQVSELAALKEELRKARKEILRLRGELMESSSTAMFGDDASLHESSALFQTPPKSNRRRSRRATLGVEEEKKDGDSLVVDELLAQKSSQEDGVDHGEDEDENYDDEEENDDNDDEEDREAKDIRQSAEKLLQWASYRSYTRSSSSAANSPDQGSVASGPQAHLNDDSSTSLLGPMIPREIESPSLPLNKSLSQDSAEP